MATSAKVAVNIDGRVQAVRERLAGACTRAGRHESEVTLIAVSKTRPATDVLAAFKAGVTDFGENRVQEALAKMDEVANLTDGSSDSEALRWHLIGHLQTNKVRAVGGRFAILHGVDSTRLIHTIGASGSRESVFLEVNVSGEESKFGVSPDALEDLVAVAADYPGIHIEGLMTVAPLSSDPEDSRPYFAQLRALSERFGFRSLSMGMTNDFEVAIEEGATHVRVGRAIFGERE